jgi:hypothetical protein
MRIGRDELAALIHEAVDPIDDPSFLDSSLDWCRLYAVTKSVEQVGPPEDVEPNCVSWSDPWERKIAAGMRPLLAQFERGALLFEEDLTERFGIHAKMLSRLVEVSDLPAIPFRGRYFFERRKVEAWFKARGAKNDALP